MSKRPEYAVGWADITLHETLIHLDEPAPGTAHALITVVDSSLAIASLADSSPYGQSLRGVGQIVGDGLLLPAAQLVAWERRI